MRISKWVFQENKSRQVFRKTGISYHLIRIRWCVSGENKCLFFGKFDVLCCLETSVLRFALLPYYRRFVLLRKGVRNVCFLGNLACFVFLKNMVCVSTFSLITDVTWCWHSQISKPAINQELATHHSPPLTTPLLQHFWSCWLEITH